MSQFFASDLLYWRWSAMTIFFWSYPKVWIVVADLCLITGLFYMNSSPSAKYHINNSSHIAFLCAFISLAWNFSNQVAQDVLYSRPLMNLFMVPNVIPTDPKSSRCMIQRFERFFFNFLTNFIQISQFRMAQAVFISDLDPIFLHFTIFISKTWLPYIFFKTWKFLLVYTLYE